MQGVRAFVCLRGICGGSGVRGGNGARGGMGRWWGWSLWWDGVAGGAAAVHAHLHRRDHAGAPRPRWRAETRRACRPQVRLKPRCNAETTPAFRDHGAGAVVSARRSGFDVAGSAGGQFPTPRPCLFAETMLECRDHAGAPKPRWSAETTLACWPQPRLKPRAAPKPRWRSETTVPAQWCRHAGVVSTLRADHQPAAK